MHSGSTVLKQQNFRAKGIDLKPALCDPKTLCEEGDSIILVQSVNAIDKNS
jgi:hypothetical protein